MTHCGHAMTRDKHEVFIVFLRLKPSFFVGTESKDAYDFLVDCHELLHKMDKSKFVACEGIKVRVACEGIKVRVACEGIRPIACCTVLYKLIAKVLANRIQKVIASVISETQAGFIPRRKGVDNIILAHELVQAYNRKNVSPRCMIKVDIQKAYDTIDWRYLEQVMAGLGFPQRFIDWAARGLRQGDPMSPFLFAIVMEYLSRNLNDLANHKQFKYHPKCSRLKITHLSFADDLLMFAKGDPESIHMLQEKFNVFTAASGLQANLSKSAMYFGGVSGMVQNQIQQGLGYSFGELPFRYLGVPLATKKLSIVQ
ncbi:hypothetical protein KY290_013446 [Solanum tuberosum]|uniref:Reverse transcriptase domain-containing protein n=1 Tax=Solanum tuberosum TaxID=4113 RepID=A0ABQ7VLR3_SOLTU|nr:hypothetical protein KY290_013446 [Solanum tuberosum]